MEGVDEAGMCMLCPSPPTLAILPLSELAWKAWMKLGEHMLWPSPPPPLLYVRPLGEYAWKAWMKLGCASSVLTTSSMCRLVQT